MKPVAMTGRPSVFAARATLMPLPPGQDHRLGRPVPEPDLEVGHRHGAVESRVQSDGEDHRSLSSLCLEQAARAPCPDAATVVGYLGAKCGLVVRRGGHQIDRRPRLALRQSSSPGRTPRPPPPAGRAARSTATDVVDRSSLYSSVPTVACGDQLQPPVDLVGHLGLGHRDSLVQQRDVRYCDSPYSRELLLSAKQTSVPAGPAPR